MRRELLDPTRMPDIGWCFRSRVSRWPSSDPLKKRDEKQTRNNLGAEFPFGQAHLIDGKEMRARFDRAYEARLVAGHSVSLGARALWVSLYHEEATDPVNRVGAGAGLANPVIYRAPLDRTRSEVLDEHDEPTDVVQHGAADDELTISEAKRRLALTLGIDPSSVKIVIEA